MSMEAQSFNCHCNWVGIDKRGKQTLYRFLAEDSTHAVYMELGLDKGQGLQLHKPPDTQSLRRRMRKRELEKRCERGEFKRVEERGIPEFIARGTVLSDEARRRVDKRRAVVDHIVANFGDRPILDDVVYLAAVKQASEFFGVARQKVREFYERYLFYGGHENAQHPHDLNKGPRGASMRRGRGVPGSNELRPGAPCSDERLLIKNGQKKKNLTPSLYKSWMAYATAEAKSGEKSLDEVVKRFLGKQVGYNRGPDGEVLAYPKADKYKPDAIYLKQLARREFLSAREEFERRGTETPGRRRALGGGSARDLVEEDQMIFDIDATILDNYLRFGDKTVVINGVERPVLLLAIDRGSNAIVGWHIYFGSENNEAYRSCVFSCFTPKDRELVRWQVQHLTGMVYGCASKVFVDRGPGVAEAARLAIVEALKIHMLMARPGDPQGKGHVEGIIGKVMKRLGYLPGSTHTTGDADDDRKKRLGAKNLRCPTVPSFMRAFLEVVSEHNLTADCRALLTTEMLLEKVPPKPVPKDIFNYNKSKRRGRDLLEWPQEVIFKKLCTEMSYAATLGKILIKKKAFRSNNLHLYAHERHRIVGKWPAVKVLKIPNAPNYLLWERDDGSLELLTGDSTLSNSFSWINDFVNLLGNSSFSKRTAGGVKRNQVAASMPKGGRDDGGDYAPARKRRASAVEEARDTRQRGRSHAEKNLVKTVMEIVEANPETDLHAGAGTERASSPLIDDEQLLDVDF